MLNRRSFVCSTLAGATLAPAAFAQQPAPVPPLVRIVVASAAGASTDILARAVAPLLAARLGNNVVVENRAGGSGMIGAQAVAKAPRDGSTLLMFSTSMISAAATMRSAPVDVMAELVPVAAIAENPLVFAVSSKTDIRTPADLVAAARARPDLITHATGGVGTIAHIHAERFNEAAGVRLKHIPYRGAAPGVVDVASGLVDVMIATNATFAGQLKTGRMRAIGVTSPHPSPAFPGLPTMNTVAPGYEATLWVGFWAPAGTPAAVVQRLNRELVEASRSPEIVQLLQADGASPVPLNAEQFAAKVRADYVAFRKLAASQNIVID